MKIMPRRRLSFRGIPWSGYGEMDTVYIEIFAANSIIALCLLFMPHFHPISCLLLSWLMLFFLAGM